MADTHTHVPDGNGSYRDHRGLLAARCRVTGPCSDEFATNAIVWDVEANRWIVDQSTKGGWP